MGLLEVRVNLRRLILIRRKPEPEPEPTVEYMGIDLVMKRLQEAPHQPVELFPQLAKVAETPEELRLQKELEAGQSMQPFEWASHVYVTVNGEVRWRCCLNLFEDDHTVYCASPGSRG